MTFDLDTGNLFWTVCGKNIDIGHEFWSLEDKDVLHVLGIHTVWLEFFQLRSKALLLWL